MKSILAISSLFLAGLFSEAQSQQTTTSRDAAVGGLVVKIPNTAFHPTCSTAIENFIFVDHATGNTSICKSGSWKGISVDSDRDGITDVLDDNDNLASDRGDPELIPGNIKSGVDILGVTGTLVSSTVVDADGDGITSTLDADDSDPNDRGDPELVSSNIRGGANIFGVAGSLVERSNHTMATATPKAIDQLVSERLLDGIYEGRTVSITVSGDEHLVANNIRGGVDVFGVTGGLQERDGFPLPPTRPTASGLTVSTPVPSGIYDGGESATIDIAGDSELISGNVKKNVEIFGVTGTYDPIGGLAEKGGFSLPDATPTAAGQTVTKNVPEGIYRGDEEVDIDIAGDSYLTSGNVKDGVTIFGVTGTYNPLSGLPERGGFSLASATPKATAQTVTKTVPAGVYRGDETVSIKVAGDSHLIAANIKKGVTIFGVTGTLDTTPSSTTYTFNQSKLKLSNIYAYRFGNDYRSTQRASASYPATRKSFCAIYDKGVPMSYTKDFNNTEGVAYIALSNANAHPRMTTVSYDTDRYRLTSLTCVRYTYPSQ